MVCFWSRLYVPGVKVYAGASNPCRSILELRTHSSSWSSACAKTPWSILKFFRYDKERMTTVALMSLQGHLGYQYLVVLGAPTFRLQGLVVWRANKQLIKSQNVQSLACFLWELLIAVLLMFAIYSFGCSSTDLIPCDVNAEALKRPFSWWFSRFTLYAGVLSWQPFLQ